MQRTLLALAALATSATVVGAQQHQTRSTYSATSAPAPTPAPAVTASTTSIGPVLGLNYTTFTGSDAKGAEYKPDVYVGGLVDFTLGVNGMFRTGLVYAGRGAKESDQGVTGKVKLHYLEIPLMLGYRFGMPGAARPYVMGGGHVGFKTGCSLEASQGGVSASVACDDPNADLKVESTDVAVTGGAGVAIPAGTSSLDLHVAYAYGLTKLVSDANTKNAGFTLAVAYMIPIGGKR